MTDTLKLHKPTGFSYGSVHEPQCYNIPPHLSWPEKTVQWDAKQREAARVISSDALAQMKSRGGRWAAYQNMDLGSQNVGHLRFLQFGEGRGCPTEPQRYPDTRHGTGWQYYIVGYVRLSDGAIVEEPQPELLPDANVPVTTIVAEWRHSRGKYFAILKQVVTPNETYFRYEGDNCGGTLAAKTEADAIVEIQKKIDDGGYFQPDSHKTKMHRVK